MCGIAGWIDWGRPVSRERSVLKKMNQAMACRGPDDEGVWLSKHAALVHRRLVVIDPEGGAQPMVRRYGGRTYVITYNGELYNMPELRRELETRGHVLTSRSDTELILAAYAEWGEDCPRHLNGIFAFAIWDEASQSLFAARDRIGVKPLFFARRGEGLVFGSELKALLAHPSVRPEVDEEGLAEVLVLGPGRTPGHGVFRGVEELRPGCWLRFDRSGLRVQAYWKLVSRDHSEDLDTTVERVRALFQDSVRRQLVSDVPVGTMLSGGLDSSSISAAVAKVFQEEGKGPLHTFSVDYAGNEKYFRPNEFQPQSDAPWVQRMAEYLGSVHHKVIIDTEELASALIPAMRARDLPGMTDVDSSLYLFSREIKKEVTVILSGECADEVFGGYPWFHREELIWADTFPWSRLIRERIRFFSPEVVSRIRAEEYVADRYREALEEVPRLPGEAPREARMRELFYLCLTRWMPVLLDRKDRMSMAFGLEVRVPFCDHRLVEYVWNVPWSMKSCDGREKGLLRRAVSDLLPEDVRMRRKSPFPKTHNPAYLEAVRSEALRRIEDPSSPLREILHVEEIRRFADRRDLGQLHLPWFGQLMNVPQLFAYFIQLDAWMREYGVVIR
ncbi:asparagine synthase (glutamine-hydrolysing) [Planifilum fulgidum]|jgi:asparagine synthase (glutamine-hydrolysing)|uniref:asparagine synthase (glutamine-hydrolyzing) n=1 Tax=Planifilum fulgidum TaxID=201973 RepID=A0A1I2SEZ7_9BACL|nr:asparagine synthase (glutamine-hydrolyzing) [Planifilum fulgidum]SFG51290.1 asparagine synthase (glutamine-hydrolysing) [Planifilum fulgidum]